jgi:putative ABC transport system permease protein
MKLRHIARYAARSILADRQRAIIAVLAVAFGVMSLVAMASVSDSISRVLLVDPRHEIGGDAWFWRESRYLSREDLEVFRAFMAQGTIEAWVPVSDISGLMLKVPGSGRVTFVREGLGFEPGRYPIMGDIVLRSGSSLTDVLQGPEDVVVTQDIAEQRDLSAGDTVLIGNQLGGSARTYRVADIAVETPSCHGLTLYYDLETAAQLTGRPFPATNVAVTWVGDAARAREARAALTSAGWKVFAPDTVNERTREMRAIFSLMLKGAGLLGLTVGGIGVANTMQVLLRRRRREVAILKTLGYGRRDLLLLFTLETTLVSLTGGLLGAAAGTGLSALLVRVASDIVTLFINWTLRPALLVGAVVVGVVTGVLFTTSAITTASDVRPMRVFRRLPSPRMDRLRGLAIHAAIVVPFVAIASLLLGSVIQALKLMVGAILGFALIGGVLMGGKWLAVQLLPTGHLPLVRMARNNLRRRSRATLFAMITLCTGTFALGLALTIIHGARDQMALQMFSSEGYNLVVLTDPPRAETALQAAARVSGETGLRFEVPLQAARTAEGRDLSESLGTLSLQGRDRPWDVTLQGAPWGTQEDGAYLPTDLAVEAGRLNVWDDQGAALTLKVAGTYEASGRWDRSLLPAPEGILVSASTLKDLGSEDAFALVAAEVPASELEAAAQRVSTAVPDMMVATADDLNRSFKGTLRNLSAFALAMASLALAAGAVLIANGVSLALIERNGEIGVLKAVGYTRSQVLRMILCEYGLVGAVASLTGLLGVISFTVGLALLRDVTQGILTVDPLSALLIMGVAAVLTWGAALASAWRPTSVSPLAVLKVGE